MTLSFEIIDGLRENLPYVRQISSVDAAFCFALVTDVVLYNCELRLSGGFYL
jgi:hypothetical protein